MIIIKIDKDKYILRVAPNEELFSVILNFAQRYKVRSGFFYGIGACKSCIIGRYNEKKRDYDWKKINQQMEIGSLIGNLTHKENHSYLHVHAVMGDKNFKTISGHIKELTVFPTCEIMFFKFNKDIQRRFDNLTNIFLIH